MDFKLTILFFWLAACQFHGSAFLSTIPSCDLERTISHFHKEFLTFPCSNLAIVNRIFKIMKMARSTEDIDRNTAKTDWLYLMVTGDNTNITAENSQNILKMLIQVCDDVKNPMIQTSEINKHRKKLETYLTPSQVYRFNLYMDEAMKQNYYGSGGSAGSGDEALDEFDFQQFYFGFPIGLALGVPEDDVTRLLEGDLFLIGAINYLDQLSHLVCDKKYRNYHKHNISRDLKNTLVALLDQHQLDMA